GAAVYMGCNSVGGTPYITRNQYTAMTVGAVFTTFVCAQGCGKDDRCLIGGNVSGSQLSVASCQCLCIDYNATTCANAHTPSETASRSSSMSLTTSPSVSQALSFSVSQSSLPSPSRSPTASITESTTVSTSTSKSGNVTDSETQTFGSRSPSQSMSPSITTSLTVTRSHSGDTASRTVRGLSISQSPSLTTSLSLTLSWTLSSTRSPTDSLSDGTLSGSDTRVATDTPTESVSFTLSVTPSATLSATKTTSVTSTNEHSLTATRSNSATQSESLSPVWPAALGITGSPATVRYLYDGLVWFNASTTASFTVWPRQLDGRDMPAGFYRHPQPQFNVSMMNSTAPVPFVATVGAQCSLSLPCEISVAPSYDRFTPVELRVDYSTPAVPTLSTTAVFAYANQAPERLQIVTDTVLTVCGGAPLPEVYLRVVDTDGYPYTASTHVPVNLTIAGGWSNFSEAYVVAGQLGPATTMAVLPAALNGTGALSLTATSAGLGIANLTFTIVQCPRVLQGAAGSRRQLHRVFASASALLPATALFYSPVS
ncbi:DGF-1-like protein, putative, partial [Bodo saltans]